MDSSEGLNTEAKQPMNRNTKIIIGIVGGLILLCACSVVAVSFSGRLFSGFLENNVLVPTEEVAALGRSILNYDLPENYAEQMGMRILGTDFVMIGAEDGSTDTFFMVGQFGFSEGMSETELRLQFESSMARSDFVETGTLEFIEAQEITINGNATTLQVFEGLSENGDELRQASAIFDTAAGHGMLMIMGTVDNWDSEAVEFFLASIEN